MSLRCFAVCILVLHLQNRHVSFTDNLAAPSVQAAVMHDAKALIVVKTSDWWYVVSSTGDPAGKSCLQDPG